MALELIVFVDLVIEQLWEDGITDRSFLLAIERRLTALASTNSRLVLNVIITATNSALLPFWLIARDSSILVGCGRRDPVTPVVLESAIADFFGRLGRRVDESDERSIIRVTLQRVIQILH